MQAPIPQTTCPTRRAGIAGFRPRQQCRSSTACAEEEDAARRGLPRDETAAVLREAIRALDARESRSRAPPSQACAQAGRARRADRRAEEANAPRQRQRAIDRSVARAAT